MNNMQLQLYLQLGRIPNDCDFQVTPIILYRLPHARDIYIVQKRKHRGFSGN